jgi:hypothetical protein
MFPSSDLVNQLCKFVKILDADKRRFALRKHRLKTDFFNKDISDLI